MPPAEGDVPVVVESPHRDIRKIMLKSDAHPAGGIFAITYIGTAGGFI
jgi:hypothetical protein